MIYSKFKEKFLTKFLKNSKNKENKEPPHGYSKFKEYLFFLDGSEEENEQVTLAINLCDDSLKLAKHKKFLEEKRKNFQETLQDIDCYNNLSDEEAEKLKALINKFIQVNNDRRNIRFQLGDFDSSINKLDVLKDEAIDVINQVEEAEAEEKILSRDIAIIKQEQERTNLDRQKLEFAYKFIYRFSFIISVVLAIAVVVLSFVSLFNNESVLVSLTILFFTLILTITLVYIIRRTIVFELKLNEKKQAKIVSLLNKKTVVYSYYLNFLNFAYSKYGVKNSRILKDNLNKYSNYKNTIKRYDQLGKILFETQKSLEEFLEDKNIVISNSSLESFAKSINIDNKISYSKSINQKKLEVEEKIQGIEAQQEEIWEKLINLNANDSTKENVIEKIMKSYLMEVEKLVLDLNENIDNNPNFD